MNAEMVFKNFSDAYDIFEDAILELKTAKDSGKDYYLKQANKIADDMMTLMMEFKTAPVTSSKKNINSSVTIDDDMFIDMLWDRVREFQPAEGYDDEFWTQCFDYLKDIGWLDENKNNPKYIVDNIAVNGQIKTFEEIEDEYDLKGQTIDQWIEENGYPIFGDYVVISLGL